MTEVNNPVYTTLLTPPVAVLAASYADTLYTFESRGFGDEVGDKRASDILLKEACSIPRP